METLTFIVEVARACALKHQAEPTLSLPLTISSQTTVRIRQIRRLVDVTLVEGALVPGLLSQVGRCFSERIPLGLVTPSVFSPLDRNLVMGGR